MILLVKKIKSKLPDIDFIFYWVLLMFIAAPLRVYAPTSFIVELSCVGMVSYYAFRGVKLGKNAGDYMIALIMISLFFIGMRGDFDEFCFKENYRFFVQFLFIAVFLNYPLDTKKILNVALLLCKLHIIFTIYELLYVNVFDYGDHEKLLFVGKAIAGYEEDSQYRTASWDLGFPFIRPFGLMLQPQKSAFVFSFGMLCKYLLEKINKSRKSQYWYFIFLLATISTSGKSAIVCALLFYASMRFNVYPTLNIRRKGTIIVLLFVIIGGVILLSYLGNTQVSSDFSNDMSSIFNYPLFDALFGHGIPSVSDLWRHGFVVECYLARVILQMGYLPFIIIVGISLYYYRAKTWKLNYMMLVLVFMLVSHYCVINTPFFQFMIPVFIATYKQYQL